MMELGKKNTDLVKVDSSFLEGGGMDLSSMILFNMGQSVQKMQILSGSDKVIVEIDDNVTVEIEEQDSRQPWRDRLRILLDLVASLNKYEGVCKKVLIADGWSWNRMRFRVPIWMLEYDEISLPEIVKEFEDLEWLLTEKFS